mgnify:CR=1 FL=1
MIGVALGLYVPLSKRLLGCILAFAAGGLLSDSTRAWFWKSLRWFIAALLMMVRCLMNAR